jgi:hypothetical protein
MTPSTGAECLSWFVVAAFHVLFAVDLKNYTLRYQFLPSRHRFLIETPWRAYLILGILDNRLVRH